jgi:proteasome accessory factor A
MAIPKLAGIETEYGIVFFGQEDSDPFYASRLVLEAYRHAGGPSVPCESYYYDVTDATSSLMLSNGARYYIDHAHPEYSTPECRSLSDLVAADKAGERLLYACQCQVNNTLPAGQEIRLYKNNSDQKNNSYGCHENYLLSATLFDLLHHKTSLMLRYFLPFLVTRTIFCGAGKVGSENNTSPVGFQLSQRADFFETLIGLQTTHHRPLFNTRDEPHANRAQFRRLHVIPGDANLAEFSTYLKVGATRLLLDMLEDGFIQDDLTLADPLAAFKTVSRDLNFNTPLTLADGRRMTALDIQHIYRARAEQYLEHIGGNDEQWEVLGEWQDVLERLPDQWETLSNRLDWAIKKRLLDRYLQPQGITWQQVTAWQPVVETTLSVPEILARQIAEQKGLRWDDHPKQREIYFGLRRLDLEYHDIRQGCHDENMGLFYQLQQRGAIERLLTDEEIQEKMITPPIDTRAWLRGQCVAHFANDILKADWDRLYFNAPLGIKNVLKLADPMGAKYQALEIDWQTLDNSAKLINYFREEFTVES